MSKEIELLPIKSAQEVAEETIKVIEEERDGKQRGLKTRWDNVNKGMLKWFRFGYSTLIAGLSGSGKSYILNMIINDFTNPELNGNFVDFKNLHILNFGYEMRGSDEMLRTLSGELGVPYSMLLSSYYDEKSDTYNRVSDEQIDKIKLKLEGLKQKPIHYINKAGTLKSMYNTVEYFKKNNPNAKIVITLDHTLLTKRDDERDEIELIALTGLYAMALCKLGCMVIFLGQLNGNIENPLRLNNMLSHYPLKTDIHGSNQLYNAMDNVIMFHRPEKLEIVEYGKHKLLSTGLVHGNLIKSRFGNSNHLWFKENFVKGNLIEIKFGDIPRKNNVNVLTY